MVADPQDSSYDVIAGIILEKYGQGNPLPTKKYLNAVDSLEELEAQDRG